VGHVLSSDTVSVRIHNGDASSIDIPSGTYTAYALDA
jgi:hypothetical protein